MTNRAPDYQSRHGEAATQQFVRTGRFFLQEGNWFFKTREGLDYGPYESKTECRYAYEEFIDVVSTSNDLGGIPVDFEDSAGDWKVPKINFN